MTGDETRGLGATIALAVAVATALFAAGTALLLLLTNPQPYPKPLFGTQNQDVESALYAFAYGVALPLGTFAALRWGSKVASGPNRDGFSALSGGLCTVLGALLLVAGAFPGRNQVLLIAAVAWLVLAGLLVRRAASAEPWAPLARLAERATACWVAAAVLALGLLVVLTPTDDIDLPVLLVAVAVAAGLAALLRRSPHVPDLPRWAGRAVDIAFIGFCFLAIPDLVIFTPEQALSNLNDAVSTGIIQFHHNFLLGPANQVLHGEPVLVHTASQYGVGSIYAIAGWFGVFPIGYGTLGLFDAFLTISLFVSGYLIMRVASVPRALAIGILLLAIVSLLYNRDWVVGAIPQDGPLRSGMPMALILVATFAARRPDIEKGAWIAAAGVVGLSSLWSFEMFALTLAALVGVVAFETVMAEPGTRRALVIRRAIAVLAAIVIVHVTFALLTLVFAGQLPDWGQYFAYLHAFLAGGLGNITYDFGGWSPGFAVGVAYGASLVALAVICVRAPQFARSERVALTALAGLTPYGIALFDYFVDRSAGHVLVYTCFPLVVIAALWGAILLRSQLTGSNTRSLGAAFAAAVACLMLAVSWSGLTTQLPDTALARGLPGGESLRDSVDRLLHPPPLDGRAQEGQDILEQHFPDTDHVITLVSPELSVEILVRAQKANGIPISDPSQDSYVPESRLADLDDSIAHLQPGERILTQGAALAMVPGLLEHPDADLLANPLGNDGLAPIQDYALREIAKRFRIVPVKRFAEDYVIARLEARAP